MNFKRDPKVRVEQLLDSKKIKIKKYFFLEGDDNELDEVYKKLFNKGNDGLQVRIKRLEDQYLAEFEKIKEKEEVKEEDILKQYEMNYKYNYDYFETNEYEYDILRSKLDYELAEKKRKEREKNALPSEYDVFFTGDRYKP